MYTRSLFVFTRPNAKIEAALFVSDFFTVRSLALLSHMSSTRGVYALELGSGAIYVGKSQNTAARIVQQRDPRAASAWVRDQGGVRRTPGAQALRTAWQEMLETQCPSMVYSTRWADSGFSECVPRARTGYAPSPRTLSSKIKVLSHGLSKPQRDSQSTWR